jgi:hypothetical protein
VSSKRAIRRAACLTAKLLTKMVAPALLPDERRDFHEEAERICHRLIAAVLRRASHDRLNIKASLN